MIYRKLDQNGDRVFGHSASDFLVNTPEAVAQAVKTRLRLFLGEWFVDVTDGTDWMGRILGTNTLSTYDIELRTRILDTPGVTELTTYSSTRDPDTRTLQVQATITTIYGSTTLTADQYIAPPLIATTQLPTELLAADQTELIGRDGALLFDPKLPLP